MQTVEIDSGCPECMAKLIDTGDELVCPSCGIARQKQVLEPVGGPRARPQDAVRPALGSYMGPRSAPARERSARGITGFGGRFGYLKAVSDFAGRDEGSGVTCAKLIERVGESLCLPSIVLLEAASTANKVLATVKSLRKTPIAVISAYSIISASRVAGVTTANAREVIAAHEALGRRVSASSVFHLMLESPVRTFARGPEEYLSRVLARLSMSRALSGRLEKEGLLLTAYLGALRETGRELLRLTDQTEMLGKRPCALAASAVYSAETVLSVCEARDRRITQREVARCGDTSEYTVREQCAVIFTGAVEKLVARRMQTLPLARGR